MRIKKKLLWAGLLLLIVNLIFLGCFFNEDKPMVAAVTSTDNRVKFLPRSIDLPFLGRFFREDKPLVSVVMPTYNRAKLLPRSIESILKQTYPHFELIIVDDGSTDKSVELIRSYQQKDPRIKLIQNEKNRGISFSRNRGMDAAKGRYLAVMDSDDYSDPERLSKSLRFFKKHPDYVSVNSVYYKLGREQEGLNNWVPPRRWEIIFNFANYYSNLAMFDLKFVRKHNIRYDENLISAEDYDFWSKIYLAGGKLGMINEPLVRVRRHQTHSSAYYETIKSVRKIVSARLLARFGISAKDAATLSQCELMKKMKKVNPQKKLVDQYTLQLTYQRQCDPTAKLPEGTLYLKHFDFVDNLLPVSNGVYKRAYNGEIYRRVWQQASFHIFENGKGNRELYRHQEDGSYALIEYLDR